MDSIEHEFVEQVKEKVACTISGRMTSKTKFSYQLFPLSGGVTGKTTFSYQHIQCQAK